MSYDLELAFPKKPDLGSIRAAAATAGLRVGGSSVLSFLDSKDQLVFTADGPHAVETEDLDEELLRVLPNPRWGMLVSRPAAAGDEGVQRAIAVATAIARANRGAVYDPQAEKLLFPAAQAAKQPTLHTKVRLVKLIWLVAQHRTLRDVATTWLGLVRQHIPDGLPRRYDSVEPMRHRLDRDGVDDFYRLWDTVNQDTLPSIYFSSAPPCHGGYIWLPGPSPSTSRPITIEMQFDGRALETNESTREACIELFAAIANALPSFYAAGYVERDWEVNRGRLYSVNETESVYILSKGDWLGFPPFPVWLSWFGRPYKERVRPSLDGLPVVEGEEGILLRIGELPQDADQLSGQFPSLPAELSRSLRPLPTAPPGTNRKGDTSLPARIVLDLTRPSSL